MDITTEASDGLKVVNNGKNMAVGYMRSRGFLKFSFGLGNDVVNVKASEVRLLKNLQIRG